MTCFEIDLIQRLDVPSVWRERGIKSQLQPFSKLRGKKKITILVKWQECNEYKVLFMLSAGLAYTAILFLTDV